MEVDAPQGAALPVPKQEGDGAQKEGESPSPPIGQEEMQKRLERAGVKEDELLPDYTERVAKALDFARGWNQRYKLQPDQSQIVSMQEAAQQARALALSCRIYVGSIVFDISQDDVFKFFAPFGGIKAVDMSHDKVTNKHKGYCFIEFETPEGAAQAIKKRNGVVLGSRPVKVGRPSNYPAHLPNGGLPLPPPERIYVANVHEGVGEKDIRDVFEAFGKVKVCVLVPDPTTQKHKGYGYLEYEDAALADAAALAMDDFDLGGKPLCVCKAAAGIPLPPGMDQLPSMIASAPPVKTVPAALTQNVNAILSTIVKKSTEESLNKEEHISISGNSRFELMQKLSREATSKTMVLNNMVQKDELDDELELDVRDECQKYGAVQKIKVHIPEEGAFAKVFVQFSSGAEASKAIQVFDGRFYSGHRIVAQPFDNNRFEADDLE